MIELLQQVAMSCASIPGAILRYCMCFASGTQQVVYRDSSNVYYRETINANGLSYHRYSVCRADSDVELENISCNHQCSYCQYNFYPIYQCPECNIWMCGECLRKGCQC